MKKNISRRDFLNGAAMALAMGATLTPRQILALESDSTGAAGIGHSKAYPPALTGMRGSHEGSYEVAHALAWRGEKPTDYTQLNETYDLIVVGAGISGLTAAYLYRQQAGPDAKILILDNHDDFGGHAKRNEFYSGGTMMLGAGGSLNLEHGEFSDNVNTVLAELGVDLEKLESARDPDYMLSRPDAKTGLFLNAQQYGSARIRTGPWQDAWWGKGDFKGLVSSLGLPSDQQQKLIALIAGERDVLSDLSLLETKRYIETNSYEKFMTERAGLSRPTAELFSPVSRLMFGLGLENISTREAFMIGAPGLKSIGCTGTLANELMAYMASDYRSPLFPDGNASVARLLVRNMLPEIAPGQTMDDIVEAKFDYSQLDRSDSPLQIRLNSTVVTATNVQGGVDVSYVEGGKAYTVKGKHCILAGYNGMIPHLVPELQEEQKANLKYGVKIPLVMANVLINNLAPIKDSGGSQSHCPGSFFAAVTEAPPVSLGQYEGQRKSGDPGVLWMAHAPAPRNNGQQTGRDLYRLGRHRLYRTPFSEYETEIKNQLDAMFGPSGFDSERDIEAITVNRWSHGYAYEYMDLYDPDWEEGQAPHEKGRKAIGSISIANSDSEAHAYLHSAMDAAARAVKEVL
ncbi:MAG: Tat pathway signal sequence domain protein [bacterium TMED88]|nr:Tat pathway signal sequence domain protein [Deltaproteobacteria bacterium]OUV22651.1 MAG: Tat pathway signal sequence domain protein [bacterium TMED88]